MNSFKIKSGNEMIEIYTNRIKYLLGKNIENKYLFFQKLHLLCCKSDSEYRLEEDIKTNLFWNDQEIGKRNTVLYEVTPLYSLTEDYKMNAKSLILKYLDLKLQETAYFDTINTIEILLQAFADELSEEHFIKTYLNGVNNKVLLKLINPSYADDFQKDEYDLKYEQLILTQLQLLRYITKHTQEKEIILIAAIIPKLTNAIIEAVEQFTDGLLFIFTETYLPQMRLEEIVLVEDRWIDLADMESIYMEWEDRYNQIHTYEEMKAMVKQIVMTQYTQHKFDLIEQLSHFYSDNKKQAK